MRALALLFVVGVALAGTPVVAQQQLAFPALTGRVVDQANVLSAETESWLSNSSESLEKATGNQLVVVTLPSLQGLPIEDYGYQLGRHWGIGRAGKNNGVLVIVAPNERTLRIEVGYGLEGTLTDAISRGIIDQRIVPRFRENDYDGGVRAGIETIVAVLSGDAQTASRMQETGSRRLAPKESPNLGSLVLIALFFFLFILPRLRGRGRRGLFYGGLGGLGGGMLGRRGGGGFGGGFRGGGGSFGGGGASGRW